MNNLRKIQTAAGKYVVLAALLLVSQCRQDTRPTLGKQEPAKEPNAATNLPKAPKKPALANVEDLLALFDAARPTRSFHTLREALGAVPTTDLISWWAALSATKEDPSKRLSAKTALAGRIVEIAPAEAHAWAAGNAENGDAGLLVERLAAEAARKPGADLRCPFALEFDQLQDAWLRGVASVLASRSPESAWQWAMGLAEGKLRDEATTKVLSQLARSHPPFAARCFNEIQSQNGDMQRSILTAWLLEDADAAWAWIPEQPQASQRGLEEHYFQSLAEPQPRLALQKIRELKSALKRLELTGKIGQVLVNSNPALALGFLLAESREVGGGDDRRIATDKAVQLWIATDGPAAQKWLLESGGLSLHSYFSGGQALLDEFGTEVALALDGHDIDESTRSILEMLMFGHWASTDPLGLKKVYVENPDLFQKYGQYSGMLAAGLAKHNWTEAVDFLLNAPISSGQPGTLFSDLFRMSSDMDPVEAAAVLADLLKRPDFSPEPEEKTVPEEQNQASSKVYIPQDAVGELASSYAGVSPTAAAQWAQKLPAAYQEAACCSVAKIWVDLDPVAASEFIAKLPVSRDRNKVVEILADRIESFDPEGASIWRESLREAKEPN